MTRFGFTAALGVWLGLTTSIIAGLVVGLGLAPPVKVAVVQSIELTIDEPVKVEAAHPLPVEPVMPPRDDE